MNDADIAFLDAILAGETPPPTPELLAAKAAHADLFGGDPDPRDAEIARLREGLRNIQAKVAAWEYKAKHNWSVDPIDLTMTAMYIDHLLEGKE